MRPVLFHLMGVPWFSWHIFFALGVACAFFSFSRATRRLSPDISRWQIFTIFFVTYLWIFSGAVMWAVWIEGFPSVSVQLARFESLAMSSSGGIIGGVIAFVVIAKILGVDLPRLSDAAVPAALLGFAIGRVGCLLNGDDYGRALPAGRGLLHEWLSWATGGGVPRYPVQLVETFFCLGAYIMLVLLRPIPSGRIAALGALLYSLMRLATEILRGDWRGPTLAIMFDLKLSPPQFIALVGFSISLGFLALGKKKLPKGSQT